ncbi:MAG: TVP38/TMEM64 family protein [Rhodospirillales bacterium]|nr:TVP38/TMEM64 family protein [Rhodospirillales bacterium]
MDVIQEKSEKQSPAKPFNPLRLLPLALIAAGFVAFFSFGLNDYLSFDALREHRQALLDWRDANQVAAMAVFIGVYAVVVALSIPGGVWMTLAGGFLFGVSQATLCVVIGATLGAIGLFLAARYACADYFHKKAGPAVRKMEDGFRENALSYLLVLRLVPLFPFWLVNLVPALLGVPLRTFIIGTFFGIIPGTAVYASVGNGLGAIFEAGGTPDLGIIFNPEILLPIAGLALLSLIPVIYKKYKKS